MNLAAEWLESYDGEADGTEEHTGEQLTKFAREVAGWLRQQAHDETIRQACRGAGVSVAAFRRHMRTNA